MVSSKVSITPIAKHEHLLSQDDKDLIAFGKMLDKPTSPVVTVSIQETGIPMILDEHFSKKRPRQPSTSQSSQSSGEDSFTKFDYAVKTIESPQGDFKLKINRTLKPKNSSANCEAMHQRISRRASLQLGIPPEKILQLQTRSPSPTKSAKVTKNKENKFSPLSSQSLFDLTTSPILNMPSKGRRPSKDSPSRKRRRVSKKLYE